MSDDRIIQQIKEESRVLQQKIHELELKINDLSSKREGINKMDQLEDKIDRVQQTLYERILHLCSVADTNASHIEKLRADLDSLKAQSGGIQAESPRF